MPRTLPLPDADHEQFSSPPLKVMLGQIRFPAILKVAGPGGLASFQDEIRREYSEFSEEQQLNLAVGPDGVAASGEARNYRFSTGDGAWSVVVNPTFLTLEASIATKYSNYSEFRDRFAGVWEVALRHLNPTRSVQQGLRYIDFLDWGDVRANDWGRYVNSHLLGLLGPEELVEFVAESLTNARLELNDGVSLALKYGLARSGPENALGFLLDTDCLSQVPVEDISVEAVLGRFDAFHDEIHVWFHWAVSPEAKERFRVVSTDND